MLIFLLKLLFLNLIVSSVYVFYFILNVANKTKAFLYYTNDSEKGIDFKYL